MFFSDIATLVDHGQDIVKVVGYLVDEGVALVGQLLPTTMP